METVWRTYIDNRVHRALGSFFGASDTANGYQEVNQQYDVSLAVLHSDHFQFEVAVAVSGLIGTSGSTEFILSDLRQFDLAKNSVLTFRVRRALTPIIPYRKEIFVNTPCATHPSFSCLQGRRSGLQTWASYHTCTTFQVYYSSSSRK